MILEKDTSVLGYPGETSKALDADHHNVCKYESRQDPNYIIVRNVLKSLVSKILTKSEVKSQSGPPNRGQSHDLKSLLGITELPAADYVFFRDQWTENTGRWIFQHPDFTEWFRSVDIPTECRLLLLYGGPASGKSVLSSLIINELIERGSCCQYFYVRAANKKKRNLSTILKSIAYQLATTVSSYLHEALDAAEESIGLDTADPRTIWERLFRSILPRLIDLPQPLYWVIDGVDEAIDPRSIVRQFADTSLARLNLRVLLVGRGTSDILGSFSRMPPSLQPVSIPIVSQTDDMRLYLSTELHMAATAEYQAQIKEEVLARSQNNFLVSSGPFHLSQADCRLQWVRLAVESLNLCHTQEDVDAALAHLPVGMEALYDRMASTIDGFRVGTDRLLAISMLRCILTSLRLLTLTELAQVLSDSTSKMLDVHKAVIDLCAGFVVIDNDGNVAMIHQTAKEYLLSTELDRPLSICEAEAHESMFHSCMQNLMKLDLRGKIIGKQVPVFYEYAATSWSKHLLESPKESESVTATLTKFMNGHWALAWIHYLSSVNQLEVLVQASRHLSSYLTKQKRIIAEIPYTKAQLVGQTLLEGWTTDLIKIVGKFGMILRGEPESIYKLIAPFCPTTSSIWQLFGKSESRNISIAGLSADRWDDSLARISPGSGSFTTSLTTAGRVIALLASNGAAVKAHLYDATTFESLPAGFITHGERVQRMELNHTGSLLATYGYRTTKVWNTTDGTCRFLVENQIGKTPLVMLFVSNSAELLLGTDDRCIRSLDLSQDVPSWHVIAELEEEEVEGLHLNAASFMAVSRDGTLVAVGSRGHPPSAWEMHGPNLIRHCWKTSEQTTFGQIVDASWHPYVPELFGLYYEGTLFRWRPYDDECDELTVRASKLSISRDGNLIATGDGRGIVKVFTTADMGLLYQLAAEDTVLGLTFSPDLRRIYDIRGQHANVWEPNALMRFAEEREKGADGSSEIESIAVNSTAAIAARHNRVNSVTALTACPGGGFYAYGTDKGDVHLYDVRTNKRLKIYSAKSFFSIDQMGWSANGRYLAFSFSGRRVVVMSIKLESMGDGRGDPLVELQLDTVMKTKAANTAITQLLFDASSERLAVISPALVQIIRLTTPADIEVHTVPNGLHTIWANHPEDSGLLLGVSAGFVSVLGWLSPINVRHQFDLPVSCHTQDGQRTGNAANEAQNSSEAADAREMIAERVVVLPVRKRKLLVQLECLRLNSVKKLYLQLDIADLHLESAVQTDDGGANVLPWKIPTSPFFSSEVAENMWHVLEFLPRDRLVHISRDFAIRTWASSAAVFPQGSPNMGAPRQRESGYLSRPVSATVQTRPTIARHLSLPDRSSSIGLLGEANSNPENNLGARPDFRAGSMSHRPLLGLPESQSQTLSQTRADNMTRAATPCKTLFYLPGDWIGQDGISLCVLWPKEKALLYPRNGEVAMVRCAGLM
jgi:WD40 repeat protein